MAPIVREPAGGPAADRGLRSHAGADLRLDPRGRAGRRLADGEPAPQSASTSAWQALAATRRGAGGGGVLARRIPGCSCAGLNRAGLGPLRSELSARELSARLAAGALGGDGSPRDRRRLRDLRPHAPRRPAARAVTASPGEDRRAGAALNTGSWILEPAFLGPRPQTSPYRAGFCVVVEAERAAGAQEPAGSSGCPGQAPPAPA